MVKLQQIEKEFGSFDHLSPRDLRAIYRRVQKLHLKRGDVLIRRGDKAEALFFALTGRFSVHLVEGGRPIAEIESGVPIGEIAFFAGGTRTATVVALRDSVVLKLRRPEFDDLSEMIPGLTAWVVRGLANRLRKTVTRLPGIDHIPVPRTIAIVPAGGGALDPRFLSLIEQVFGPSSGTDTVFMREAVLRQALPSSSGFEDSSITAWLNAQEERREFVIYVGDNTLSEWSRKAIRQADVVILVAGIGADPTPGPTERFVDELHSPEQKHLVLLHERRLDKVTGTERWLSGRSVRLHHHVALSDTRDVARLKRFLDGTALGFVACGGGSYCSLHVGIHQAFADAGYEFDIYGGSSGGAAMAAAFARYLPAEEIDKRTHEIFVERRALRRVTLPYYSIFDHKPFDDALRDHYGNLRIEDLWQPYYALATNLSDASHHIIRTGPLWEAVRASGSVPGMLPPFATDEGVPLVDGSIIDNVSLDAMKSLKRGPNIVVNFVDPQPMRYKNAYDRLPGRNALFMRHLMPFGAEEMPEYPSIATTIVRSMMASHKRLENVSENDLVLLPPMPKDVSLMDWTHHTRLAAEGYEFATAMLAEPSSTDHPALQAARSIAAGNRDA